jgi:hypothetical protein
MLRWIRGNLENFTAENDFIVTDVEVLTKDLFETFGELYPKL